MAEMAEKKKRRGHHESHFRQRVDGRWECQFTLPNGQRKSVYGKSRADVRAKKDDYLKKTQRGIDIKGERQTVKLFMTTWLAETASPKLRPSTIKSYESYIRLHIIPALGDTELGNLTAQDVQRFLNACTKAGLSPRTVQYIRAILRSALAQALHWGFVDRNVAALASPPRQDPKEIQTLSAADADRLIVATNDDRMGPLFMTALYTGMRQAELLGLRWPDLDLDAGILRVRQTAQKIDGNWQFVEPKSKSGKRAIPLTPAVIEALKTQKERVREMRAHAGDAWQEWGLVFPSAVGTPIDGSNVTHHLQRCLVEHDLPRVTFHALRHTCGSLLHQEGIPARTIMEILGHSQITLTLGTYCHATPAMFDEAAGALARAIGGVR